MSKICVITYYNGNLKYINKNINLPTIIYNKKEKINSLGQSIENIGVDAYDKLHYIINNYDNLPDIVLFLTDNIDKCKKKRRQFKYIVKNLNKLENSSGFLTGHINKILRKELKFKIKNYKNKSLILSSIRPFHKWFNKIIDNSLSVKKIYIFKKGLFAVTKDLIQLNSKDYYIKLLQEIKNHSKLGSDTEVLHYFERVWVYIFTHNNKDLMFHNNKRYGKII